MRGFAAVFEREIAERRLLFAAALLLGLVPLAMPLLPGVGQRGGPEVRSATALALALCFSFGLAVLLGASVIARDLAERRLGFYFSRPIGGWAIWSGKLSAAFALALIVGVLILLPAAVIDRRFDLSGLLSVRLIPFGAFPSATASALLWAVQVLLLVLLSHAASVALRSRSPWLVLDFAGLGLVGWLASAAARRLAFVGAVGATTLVTTAMLVAGLLALIAGGARQVLGGRTDIRRGHRLQSLTLWGALLAACLLAQGYASWVLAAGPEDLRRIVVTGAEDRGPWIACAGTAAHRAGYAPALLLDVASGRHARLQTLQSFWSPPRFSADGRWAVWLEPREGALRILPLELVRLDLRDPRSRPERTGMTYASWFSLFALSADGGRVAVAAGRRLTLEAVPSGRLLASAELPVEIYPPEASVRFVGPDRVRVFSRDILAAAAGGPAAFEVREMRATGGGLVRTARLEAAAAPDVSRDATRILARRKEGTWAVFDAETGAVLAELPAGGATSRGAFLADGRIALATGDNGRELRIFSPAAAPERTFRFPSAKTLRLGGQPAPDRLLVAAAPRGPAAARWDLARTLLLNLQDGSIRRLGAGWLPSVGPAYGPASAASRLLQNASDRLVRIDPESGAQTLIAGRRSG